MSAQATIRKDEDTKSWRRLNLLQPPSQTRQPSLPRSHRNESAAAREAAQAARGSLVDAESGHGCRRAAASSGIRVRRSSVESSAASLVHPLTETSNGCGRVSSRREACCTWIESDAADLSVLEVGRTSARTRHRHRHHVLVCATILACSYKETIRPLGIEVTT
jgi:hypothetical protein